MDFEDNTTDGSLPRKSSESFSDRKPQLARPSGPNETSTKESQDGAQDGIDVGLCTQLTMTKRQLKRQLKRQRLDEIRAERKKKQKEAKRKQAIADGRDLEAEKQFMMERTASGDRKRRLQELWDTQKIPLAKSSFQICLDCSFGNLMREREVASLAQQLRYCYSYNKNSQNPCFVVVTSLRKGDATLEILERETGFSEWGNRLFTCTETSLEEYFSHKLKSVVYLTSDAEHTIETLENDKIYVIGGIVDRNRLKRAAITKAEKLGVVAAKLPLDEYLAKMTATKVLTCNHVFDILLKYREHGTDWSKAFQAVLPSRKDATFKGEEKK